MLEHPWGSAFLNDLGLEIVCRKRGIFRIDMCACNPKCPGSQRPIQKATGLMCSRPSVSQHLKQCPGCAAGQLSSGIRRSQFVSRSLSNMSCRPSPLRVSTKWIFP